jgi:hypothetical protein
MSEENKGKDEIVQCGKIIAEFYKIDEETGLSAEVLWSALNDLNIDIDKFDEALFRGRMEWDT